MQVGDLVVLRGTLGEEHNNTFAVVIQLSEASMTFPRRVVDIMLNDGTCLEGINANMLEVVAHESKYTG